MHVSRERPVAVAMVLAAAGSLQVGAAFAVTLFDELGPGGAAFLRLAFAAIVLCTIWRPSLEGDLRLAAAFGVALGLMNWSIYESIDRLPPPARRRLGRARRSGDRAAGRSVGRLDRRPRRPVRADRGGLLDGLHPPQPAHRTGVPGRRRARARDGRRRAGRRAGRPDPGRLLALASRSARLRAGRGARVVRAAVLAGAGGAAPAARRRLRRADVARAGGRRARRLRRARAGPR